MAMPSLNHASVGDGFPDALHVKVTLMLSSFAILFCGLMLNSGSPGVKKLTILCVSVNQIPNGFFFGGGGCFVVVFFVVVFFYIPFNLTGNRMYRPLYIVFRFH
jgi:hypothetical protein